MSGSDVPFTLNEVFAFAAKSGVPIQMDGGCDDCDAYQRVWRDRFGIWHITIHHDDWCSTLARIEGRGR